MADHKKHDEKSREKPCKPEPVPAPDVSTNADSGGGGTKNPPPPGG